MTIVPREWESVPVATARRLPPVTALQSALLAVGAVAIIIGAVLLARGQDLGFAALTFGAGNVVRAVVDRSDARDGRRARH